MDEKLSLKVVQPEEYVTFQCRRCGGCCRHVADSIMLTPLDIFRLGKYLRKQGEPIEGLEDVIERYAHPAWLPGNFPVFLMNTVGTVTVDVCAFLKAGRCSVYEARPQTCRLYPFSAAPGENGEDFQYYLCTEYTHHFSGGKVSVKKWLDRNFSEEDRAFLKAEYDAVPAIGKSIQRMGEERFREMLFTFLYYRYYDYDLEQSFLPQFQRNMEQLKRQLAAQEV